MGIYSVVIAQSAHVGEYIYITDRYFSNNNWPKMEPWRNLSNHKKKTIHSFILNI